MPKQIVALRFKGGDTHRHIAGIVYIDIGTRPLEVGSTTVQGLLTLMESGQRFTVRLKDGPEAEVIRVRDVDGTVFVQSRIEDTLTDNLLALPRYSLE
ncbi:MAG: hypothetical protein JWM87_1799 [Candidatus Eremiobacteraeota bacterium]|nr:hypothetical protein [Candidatus Eremiobacteraeota bacterium]